MPVFSRLGEPVKDRCNEANYYGNMQITETRGFTRRAGWGVEVHKLRTDGPPYEDCAIVHSGPVAIDVI
jgi:hypothetical protein